MFVHAYNCVKVFDDNIHTYITRVQQLTVKISLKNVLNAKFVFEGKFISDISRLEHLPSVLRNLILYQSI